MSVVVLGAETPFSIKEYADDWQIAVVFVHINIPGLQMSHFSCNKISSNPTILTISKCSENLKITPNLCSLKSVKWLYSLEIYLAKCQKTDSVFIINQYCKLYSCDSISQGFLLEVTIAFMEMIKIQSPGSVIKPFAFGCTHCTALMHESRGSF